MITLDRLEDTSVCVARIAGELDSVTVPELREGVQSAMTDGCTSFVFDLTRVTYLDSSALGFIVWVDRRLQPVSGRVTLAGAGRNVSRILELSGLIGLAPSVKAAESVEEALTGLVPRHVGVAPEWTESFSFAADVREIAAVRNRVTALLEPLGLPDSAVFDVKVAVGEALANAVRHGSPRGTRDRVDVRVTAYEDRVDVTVCDSGSGFDGEARPGQDIYASSGRGVLFMRALMDVVEFTNGETGGTSVRLGKRRVDLGSEGGRES